MKLLTQVSVITAFDVFNYGEGNRKFCFEPQIETIGATLFVFLVQENVEQLFFVGPFGIAVWIDTPTPVEVSLTENQR